MKYIKVNYKITIYDLEYNVKVIDNLCGNFNSNILFPQLINLLIKENNIKYFQIYVENSKSDTWGKLFGEDLYNQIEGDNYHYKWLNYNLKDIQTVPIGIEEETLEVSTYNFTKNLINLINAEDIDALTSFSKLLIKEVSSLTTTKVMVIDYKNLYQEELSNVIYINSQKNNPFEGEGI